MKNNKVMILILLILVTYLTGYSIIQREALLFKLIPLLFTTSGLSLLAYKYFTGSNNQSLFDMTVPIGIYFLFTDVLVYVHKCSDTEGLFSLSGSLIIIALSAAFFLLLRIVTSTSKATTTLLSKCCLGVVLACFATPILLMPSAYLKTEPALVVGGLYLFCFIYRLMVRSSISPFTMLFVIGFLGGIIGAGTLFANYESTELIGPSISMILLSCIYSLLLVLGLNLNKLNIQNGVAQLSANYLTIRSIPWLLALALVLFAI